MELKGEPIDVATPRSSEIPSEQNASFEALVTKKPSTPTLVKMTAVAPETEKPPTRDIDFGKGAVVPKYDSNSVRTAKYTALTFLPKSLLWQFKRSANIYFLIITILTCLPFSPKNPFSIISTFSGILIFTMIKEGYEDWGRHKADNDVNNSETLALNYDSRQFESKTFK
jgi:magnesium-transporting ATPase (P-type)